MAFSRFAQLRPADGSAENHDADETRDVTAHIKHALSSTVSAMLMAAPAYTGRA